ncbi:hypothetical protein WR25_26030 [Diploscapter pachys]|uniref:Uncharacterized protein n=1 Tax=Diploscapter pachys TaxID=2018661 RepID=A0A2A2K4N9_9BILA|nr:hypothetical protein WR25_26030 [Diploscapter pachys]
MPLVRCGTDMARGELAKPPGQPGNRLAPADMPRCHRFVVAAPASQPDAQVAALLEPRVAGAFHRARQRQRAGDSVEQVEVMAL